jgi:hypothetical protein
VLRKAANGTATTPANGRAAEARARATAASAATALATAASGVAAAAAPGAVSRGLACEACRPRGGSRTPSGAATRPAASLSQLLRRRGGGESVAQAALAWVAGAGSSEEHATAAAAAAGACGGGLACGLAWGPAGAGAAALLHWVNLQLYRALAHLPACLCLPACRNSSAHSCAALQCCFWFTRYFHQPLSFPCCA